MNIQTHPDGVTFKVFVQPRASRNEFAGLHGDALKVRLTAPPVEGAANEMCTRFIAKELGVPRSAVEIAAGRSARLKTLRVTVGEDAAPDLLRRLEALIKP